MKYDAFPSLSSTQLDAQALLAWVRQLLSCECDLCLKTTERTLVEADENALAAACSALAGGQLRALQVRYVHEGVRWIDTVFKTEDVFMLVRMESDLEAA